MNKKLIRLTEGDLHRIVKESVNRVLRESAYDMNSLEYKQMYDSGGWNDEDDYMDKEIKDYEALPDKARHPYGADFPDFSDRIKNRPWNFNSVDKLATKKPNSIYQKQQEKKRHKEWVNNNFNMAKQDLPFLYDYLEKRGMNFKELNPEDLAILYSNYKDKLAEKERESNLYL